MPFGDRTGPQGLGPGTGRGAGHCARFGAPISMNPLPGGSGLGFGCGGRAMGCQWVGRGRGWQNWYRATGMHGWARSGFGYPSAPSFTAEEELTFLRDEAEYLRKQLVEIENRISNMEKSEKKEE